MARYTMDLPRPWNSDLATLHRRAGALREVQSFAMDSQCGGSRPHFWRPCFVGCERPARLVSHSSPAITDFVRQCRTLVRGRTHSLPPVWPLGARAVSLAAPLP